MALLELSDQSHFNALSIEMSSDMELAVRWLSADERNLVKVVILQGAGDHFCPGGNLFRRNTSITSMVGLARSSFDLFNGFCRLRTLPVPVSCAAQGTVIGGGLAVCLLTDCVVSSHSATFKVGERSRRIYPAGMLTRTLLDVFGAAVATSLYIDELSLTGT